jgi:hypothetical protein
MGRGRRGLKSRPFLCGRFETRCRKPLLHLISKPVGETLTNLRYNRVPNSAADGGLLLGRNRVQSGSCISTPLPDPLAHPGCKPVSDDDADGGRLLGREHGLTGGPGVSRS